MSGKTSETRCKQDEQIYPATTECISGQHEDCSGRGPLITNRKEIVDCKCKCHEPTPPEGEAVPEQRETPKYTNRHGEPCSDACGQGRHAECTETFQTCNCTFRGLHKTMHRYATIPAATPVTVEAPAPNPKAREIAIELCAELVNSDPLLYCPATVKKIENQIVELCVATPKPIGDVEAAAKTLYEKGFRYEGPVIFACEFGVTAESAQIETIAAILSPFFAPAPPCSECATRSKEVEKAQQSRKHTQDWYAGRYGKLEDWARKILPEPYCTQFFSCIANGTYDAVKDVGEPYMSKVGLITPSGYVKFSTAQEQILHDQTTRAEKAELECATLRKERDDARKSLESELHYTNWDKLHRERETKGRAEAAEAQLSTLRDALENKLNRALSDAKDINGYATNDDGGLGMRLLKVAGHTTGMIIRLERELKEIVAPTPEVAKE